MVHFLFMAFFSLGCFHKVRICPSPERLVEGIHHAARLSAPLSLGASTAAAMIFTASPGRKG